MALIMGFLGTAFGRLGAFSEKVTPPGPPPTVFLKADLSSADFIPWVFW